MQGLINKSELFVNTATRAKVFDTIFAYLDKEAYCDFLFAQPVAGVSSTSLTNDRILGGPATTINFESLAYKK